MYTSINNNLDIGNFISNVQLGDSIKIKVKEADFINNNRNIAIIEVETNQKKYLTIDNAFRTSKRDKIIFIIILSIIILLIIILLIILSYTGFIDKIKQNYFTENKSQLSSIEDFTEFQDNQLL